MKTTPSTVSPHRSRTARRVGGAVAAAVLALSLTACGADESTPQGSGTPTGSTSGAASGITLEGFPAPMPDLDLPGFAGAESLNLRDIEGPTLVNVWATWCGPCRAEMPVLEEFSQKHGERVSVLGINYQDPREKSAIEFAESTGVTYPSLRDVDGQINRLEPFPFLRGLPFMAMVVDGEMVGAKFGAVHDLEDVEELAETLMPGVLADDEAAPGGDE